MENAGRALKALLDGNARFAETEPASERERHTRGQSPIAVVFYCSDSRVVADRITAQEKRGVIFGIQLAGNIVTMAGRGSAVYAVEQLHVPLIVVLGHTHCGAVKAAKEGGHVHDKDLAYLLGYVKPDTEENVREQLRRLMENTTLMELVKDGKLKVVGAVYDLESNRIRVIEKMG